MGVLKNARNELFIQEIVKGRSQRKAYPRSKNQKMKQQIVKLVHYSIMERYQELLKKAEDVAVMSVKDRKK